MRFMFKRLDPDPPESGEITFGITRLKLSVRQHAFELRIAERSLPG